MANAFLLIGIIMVKLQKLVLRNFKSFRKADIPISKGFTAIVGSNGSGKTNILDALLFVLGTSSMKMLRASKIEELVNNSAVENYAKVELVIKEGEKTYTLQRMIDKQGKSVYRLDGKRKTRNELTSLLLELGIKPDGHNIVVQGDTTRVIEMSPLERRQIIDELAGLQEFDSKKEEALKELQKVDNRLRDASIVLQERESYLEQLRQDKEAASEFGSLQEENKKIKATILFTEIENIEKAEKECKEKLELVEKERKRLEGEITETLKEKTGFREKAEKLNKEILAQKEKTYATIGAKLEEAKTGKALLQERFENKKMLVDRNDNRAQELEERTGRIEKEIEEQKERSKEITSKLGALENKIESASGKKIALEESAKEKETSIAEMNEELDSISKEFSAMKEKIFEKKSGLNTLQKEIELKKESMREILRSIEKLEPKIQEKENKTAMVTQIEKKHGGLEEKISKLKREGEKNLESLKETEAEQRKLSEGLELLEKSAASCPVCDSELAKDKKDSLATKKETELKDILKKQQALKQTKSDLASRLEEVEEALEKKRKLSAETADLKEIREEILQEREKLSEIKQWLAQNNTEQIKKETEGLEEKADAKKSALEKQREKVSAFQESIAFSSLQEAINSLNALEKERDSLKQEKENLEQSTARHFQRQKEDSLAETEMLREENEKLSKEMRDNEENLKDFEIKVARLESKVSEAERESKKMAEEKEKLDSQVLKIEESIRMKQGKQKSLGQQENSLMIDKSKQEVRLTDLKEEAQEFQAVERIKEAETKDLEERLKEIDKRIQQLGAINMKALESFNQLETEVLDVRRKVEKLDEERLAVVEMIEKIDVKRTNVFMDCFEELSKNFSKMFNVLFNGEGRLELSNREKPLESGLLIQAKHKGNSIQNIDSMSGGEKTMTALAFLFAIQVYEPASFYVFDEADAALDKENSVKMARIIKEISLQSQFIAITHNDPLVQEADQIIGVALNKQKSSVIGLKLREKT